MLEYQLGSLSHCIIGENWDGSGRIRNHRLESVEENLLESDPVLRMALVILDESPN
jgi:hypothetical protein